MLFEGLPAPTLGKLTLYVLGPGIGESQVVALPDGKWMVVDTCKQGNVTLPLALLQHFGAKAIDLLVVSHPDRDHYKGLPEIVAGMEVKLLWRYQGYGTRRPLLAKLCKLQPDNLKLASLRAAEEAMGRLTQEQKGFEVGISTLEWPRRRDETAYQISCIAPCPTDLQHQTEEFIKLFKLGPYGISVSSAAQQFLLGKANGIDGKGNPLSLALVIRWGTLGILLGGDVEAPSVANRGWRGVVRVLEKEWPKSVDLLRNLALVKVPHHGSIGAFCDEAWRLHTQDTPAQVAIVTPFRGSGNSPPQRETFRALKGLVQTVALTAAPVEGSSAAGADPWERLTGEGWARIQSAQGPGVAPCVAVVVDGKTAASVTLSTPSARFHASAMLATNTTGAGSSALHPIAG